MHEMNRLQIIILLSGLGIVVLLFCIPPWKYIFYAPSQIHVEIPGPYALIFTPPEVPITEISRIDTGTYFHSLDRDKWSVKIDLQRMLLPVIPVAVLIIVLLLLFRTPKLYES